MGKQPSHNHDLIRARRVSAAMRTAFAPMGIMLHLLSLLPFPVLYLMADLLGFVARHIVRYRRRLVRRNIADSFPEMTAAERSRIERRFYRRLGDYFVETVKMRTITPAALRRRMVFVGTELVDSYLGQGRDIVIYTSHFGNWEWITSMSLWCSTAPEARFAHVYRPLKQPWFDRWWLVLRGRFNTSIPMKGVLRRLLAWRRDGTPWITGFLSDQKPSHAGTVREVEFLGRPTPFIYGTEELARRLDAVVMLFDTEVISRGHYRSTVRLVTDTPRDMAEGEITRIYADSLTEQIRRAPAAYLWSHNRWRIPRRDLR